MPSHNYDGVKAIITSLGGPLLGDTDVYVAGTLDAGNPLLTWLQSQVPYYQEYTIESNVGASWNMGEERVKAAVRDVALERDEVVFAENNDLLSTGNGHFSARDYIPPSRLRIHAKFIKEESEHVRRQIDQLTFRISKTKEASTGLVQSIKSVQRNFDTLVSKSHLAEEKVAELGIHSDATLSTTIFGIQYFFLCLGRFSTKLGYTKIPEGDDAGMGSHLESATAFLLSTSNRISSTSTDLCKALNTLYTIKSSQPARIRDLQNESTRLQTAFDLFKTDHSISEEAQSELQDICLLLEREASTYSERSSQSDLLTSLLLEAEGGEIIDRMMDIYDLDVEQVLQHAWTQDQVVMVQVESDILDEACNSLSSLLEPLRSLYTTISALVNCIQEVEAVVEAFIDELGNVKRPEMGNDEVSVFDSKNASEIERELKRVMTENRDCRPPDAPPLLLQNQGDILFELRTISKRLQTIEQVERELSKELRNRTSIRPLHTALPEIYANSPLNCSPALALPEHVQQLKDTAKTKAGELQGLAKFLEDEYRNTNAKDSNIKRLIAFVEKWTSSS